MNDKDRAAFSSAWAHFSSKYDPHAWEFKEGFEAALAHRDAQAAGLVEALREFSDLIEYQYTGSQEAMSALQNADNKAQKALAAWEATK